MAKFSAADCKNFEGNDVTALEEQKIVHICTTPYCVDRNDCDGEVVEIIQDVHFEVKAN